MAGQAATLAPVSSEDVEIARQVWDAWQRGDVATVFKLIDPDVVSTQFPEQVDTRPYYGHDGVREVMIEWIGTWDDYEIELLDLRPVGEAVVASLHQRGRGKGSGAAMEGDVWFVWRLRGGRIVRWQMFSSEAEALAAAG
jgi:ketosteroid isomerase-like protein